MEFRDLLRKSGYKVTPARLAVLAVLQHAKKPLNTQSIAEALPFLCDQVTVYRTLWMLERINAVRRIDFQHGHAHYELADAQDHHHLVCLDCGRTEDIHGCDAQDMEKGIIRKSRVFKTIQHHSLEFYGYCKKCAKN